VINILVLKLVNPDDLPATPEGIYPDSVNKRVPYMIQTLGYIYIGMIVVAGILMFPGPEPTK